MQALTTPSAISKADNNTTHVALVIDKSLSMKPHQHSLPQAIDAEIAHLAARSKELGEEVRVSVYLFNDEVECVIFDMDALRLPSIATLYKPNGNTALIDATVISQQELATTSQIHGNHAFLTFVWTDGQENVSRTFDRMRAMANLIAGQGENWTIGFFVPNQAAVFETKRFGVPAANISVWDTLSKAGLEKGASDMRAAVDNYMVLRSSGGVGTRSLFSTGSEAVNATTVARANLTPLTPGSYLLIPVPGGDRPEIRNFVLGAGHPYVAGNCFYELKKAEDIQATKDIIIVNKKTNVAYTGQDARHLLGLPSVNVRVRPTSNPDWSIFVQSTSVNRKLDVGTRLLIKLNVR